VVLADINEFKFKNEEERRIWEEIDKENEFSKGLERVVKETLYIGDGAFKISGDSSLSQYPILEYYPGDQLEFVHQRGRLREIIFKTPYSYKHKCYMLHEHYGYGYIKNKLYYDGTEVPLSSIPQTEFLLPMMMNLCMHNIAKISHQMLD